MIQIDCRNCNNHCCGSNPHLTPVLLPSEEEKFKKYAHCIKTSYRPVWTLAKKENGNCIFLEDEATRCTIYNERPLECRLYPFLLDFSKEKPDVKLDERFCPRLRTLLADKERIAALVQIQQFPKDWIEAYQTLEDY